MTNNQKKRRAEWSVSLQTSEWVYSGKNGQTDRQQSACHASVRDWVPVPEFRVYSLTVPVNQRNKQTGIAVCTYNPCARMEGDRQTD